MEEPTAYCFGRPVALEQHIHVAPTSLPRYDTCSNTTASKCKTMIYWNINLAIVHVLQDATLMADKLSHCCFGVHYFHEGLFFKRPWRAEPPQGLSTLPNVSPLKHSLFHCRTQHTHTQTHMFTLLSAQLSPAVTLKPFRKAATAKCDVSSNLSFNSYWEALK